ncbi:MAG: HAD family hydrolase [Gemmatimonadaceae bacterium]
MKALPAAVFLDRDGTIIEDGHYISRPDQVRLIDGAAEAIARINAALIPAIVVTNQSGIGRGLFTTADYERLKSHLGVLLAARGAHIDDSYHCPHAPEDYCDCRKPGIALFERAARDHPEVVLGNSLYIGDRWRDISPGIAFGGDGVLVPGGDTPPDDIARARESGRVAPSIGVALDWYLCTN